MTTGLIRAVVFLVVARNGHWGIHCAVDVQAPIRGPVTLCMQLEFGKLLRKLDRVLQLLIELRRFALAAPSSTTSFN